MPAWTSKRISDADAGRGRAAFVPVAQVLIGLVVALVPLFLLAADVAADRLTANPVQEIEQQTGKAAYLLLLLSLAVTPLVRLLQAVRLLGPSWGADAFAPLRRVLGWAALIWALGHFLVFVGLDYAFDPGLIWGAVADKRFALVGLSALLLLVGRAVLQEVRFGRSGAVLLGVSSLTPLAAALVTLHYLWAVKVITAKEIAYGLVTAVILAVWAGLRWWDRRGG